MVGGTRAVAWDRHPASTLPALFHPQRACRLLLDHNLKANTTSPHFANINYADIDELYHTIIMRRFPDTTRTPNFTVSGLFPISTPLRNSIWISSRRRLPQLKLLQVTDPHYLGRIRFGS